jgi:hypothetical protein
MAEDGQLYYYILFETYTQGMLLQEYLKADGIKARIAPAPRSIQGELGCGMSLRFLPEDLEGVRACIEKNHAEYYDIVPLKSQINPNRHKFC